MRPEQREWDSVHGAAILPKHWNSQKLVRYENNQKNLIAFERYQMLDWTDKDFRTVIIKIFKELKEIMLEEVQEGMMTMSDQIENVN